MRLISYIKHGRAAIGAILTPQASEFVDLGDCGLELPADMTQLLAAEGALNAAKGAVSKAPAEAVKPLAGITYLPVVPRPPKIICDELPAGAAGLRIQSRLNGKVMQDANTKDFLVDVVAALCTITECMSLEPGDVIITGTPAGVGYARTPPVFMAPGDVSEVEIEGVGVLSNPIADEV